MWPRVRLRPFPETCSPARRGRLFGLRCGTFPVAPTPAGRASPFGRVRAIAVESGLNLYLRQINETPLLTAEQEKEVAIRIREGTDPRDREAARDRMVRSNLRLVVNIAKHYVNRGLALADLIEEGNVGLLKAVQGFDPHHGNRFSTYATWWIKQAIKRALLNCSQNVRIPAYMVETVARWKQTTAKLTEELGREPEPEEVAARMQLPARKLRILKRAVRALQAGTQSTGDDGNTTLAEMLEDTRARRPEESFFDALELDVLRKLLGRISDREARVLRLRFGLDNTEPMTLRDIGEQIGLTRERVRQIEREALNKLHHFVTEQETATPAAPPAAIPGARPRRRAKSRPRKRPAKPE